MTNDWRPKAATGFTLIELLVVLLIIMILAGLLLAAVSALRDSAEVLVTKQRLQDLRKAVLERSTGDRDAIALLEEEMLGRRHVLRPLRVVLAELQQRHGLDLDDSATWRQLPPNLASMHDDIGCYAPTFYARSFKWFRMLNDPQQGLFEGGFQRQSATLDNVIVWAELRDFAGDLALYPPTVDVADAVGTVPYYRDYQSARDQKDKTFFWWRRDRRAVMEDAEHRHAWLWRKDSPLGGSLDATLELMPDTLQPTTWYLEHWPVLSETRDGDHLVQRAWPDSDWDRAAPGTVPPVWEVPFGHRIIARHDGEPAEQYLRREDGSEGRTLADFSPLASRAILHFAGLLADDGDSLRQDRSREAAWNDRWGNPLVCAAGLYLAPRYDLDPADPTLASHGRRREFTAHLHGGRDWLARRALEVYGFNRAAYIAVGALGEHRGVSGTDNPIDSVLPEWTSSTELSWSADQDAVVFRAAWLQVATACEAARFDDAAMLDGSWGDGIRIGRQGGRIMGLLAAPAEVH